VLQRCFTIVYAAHKKAVNRVKATICQSVSQTDLKQPPSSVSHSHKYQPFQPQCLAFVDRHMSCGGRTCGLKATMLGSCVTVWCRRSPSVDGMGAGVDDMGTDEVQSNSRRSNQTDILLQQWTSHISPCFPSSISY